MKKLIIAIGIIATAAISAQAQGSVVLGNSNGTRVSTNGVVGGAATGLVGANTAQTFYYALFATTTLTGSTATAAVGTNGVYAFSSGGSWQNAGQLATNGAAGRLFATTPNTDGSVSASGVGGGSAGFFTVIGWSGNIGSTVSSLQAYLLNPTFNAWVGQSVVSGSLVAGTLGSTPAVGLWGATTPNIQGFTLGLVAGSVAPVPEPGTMALAALGGASLLLFRRKK